MIVIRDRFTLSVRLLTLSSQTEESFPHVSAILQVLAGKTLAGTEAELGRLVASTAPKRPTNRDIRMIIPFPKSRRDFSSPMRGA